MADATPRAAPRAEPPLEESAPDGAAAGSAGSADPHAAIVAELRARFGDAAAGPAVAIYLAARGYDPARIAAVLGRMNGGEAPDSTVVTGGDTEATAPGVQSVELTTDRGEVGEAPDTGVPTTDVAPVASVRPLRAWAPHERARFSADAWGRLLQLRAAGLGDHEFEHLVDRALLQLDGPVTLPELRALLGDALGPGDTDPPTLH
jgi:hypothetical protein